ncbi:MAG: long-chain-fatty-acid--CoA ligase [Candidatus Methylopumilus sp.]|nr:long-chain-fatty-acid--CoA ligase [Candidatus Methylopumilus sp.]
MTESTQSNKPWLKHYPEGVPENIDISAYASLVALFEDSFRRFAQRNAYLYMGKALTFAQLDLQSRSFANYLQTLGLEPGARVAIMLPNVLQFPIAMIGALRAGCVVVNTNPLYTARELEHQLNDSGASVLIVLENFAHIFQSLQGKTRVKHVVVTSLGEHIGLKGKIVDFVVRHVKKLVPQWSLPGHVTFTQALATGRLQQAQAVTLSHDSVAFLQYTGGTTGVSKGAVLLHRNILANIEQVNAWLKPALLRRPIEQLVFLCALPLYHIFALTSCAMVGLREGGTNILVPNPKDIAGFIKLLAQHPEIHIFPGVNTLFNALNHHPEFAKVKLPNLLVTIGGGMAVQKPVAERWQTLTSTPIVEGYGLSETSPVACVNTTIIEHYTGHIGLPVPSTEIRILADDGSEVALGSPGEIAIRGPQVMAGYWNKPQDTAEVMTADGFFKSGDIGLMDQGGYVKIIDRKKDMIVISGFKVFPNELEEVITLLPGVLECAAIGVPDEHTGEAVKLFVVKKDATLTEQQILAYCKEQLTNYKRPKQIVFKTELPKSNVGKILRRELRDLA